MQNRTMFAQSILPSSASAPATAPRAAPSSGFAAALAAQQPDPMDEEKALRELFHILSRLASGVVDYPAETSTGTNVPGPYRIQVEALKEVLRRLMNGSAGRPARTGHKGDPEGLTDLTFQDLYASLPPEIRALLRHAFPKFGDLLRTA